MKVDSSSLIRQLGLESHLAGGFYRQTWESADEVSTGPGRRPLANTIYYLLSSDSPIGYFHRNLSEITHFLHLGGPIEYLLVKPDSSLSKVTLGFNADAGEVLSFSCPGGWWKCSYLPAEVECGLISEIVVPGFRYQDQEMASVAGFRRDHPQLLDVCRAFLRR
jgi:predicted cupin superfamily sugar epimerase